MTDEELGRRIIGIINNSPRFGSEESAKHIGSVVRELLAPPISRMSVEEIREEMHKTCDKQIPKHIDDIYNQLTLIFARVAHRLAQPARVDEDRKARELAWLQYDTAYPDGHPNRGYNNPEALWANKSDAWRNGWRAVAAKEAGDA